MRVQKKGRRQGEKPPSIHQLRAMEEELQQEKNDEWLRRQEIKMQSIDGAK